MSDRPFPLCFRINALWRGEIPSFSVKYQWIGTLFMLLFAFGFAFGSLGWAHYVAYLGPGLGDNWTLAPMQQLWQQFGAHAEREVILAGFTPHQLGLLLLITLNVTVTAGIILAGYLCYPTRFKRPYPLHQLFTFFALNSINSVLIALTLASIGVMGWLLGLSFEQAYGAFESVLKWTHAQALSIPTLLDVPAWLAFLLVVNIGGFFHYWAHRLSHESRLFWLLFHRTHHMTPELIQPTAQAVFFAFPLFLVVAIPYVFVFTAIAKLITHDIATVISFIFLYKMIAAFATTFSHQSALYDFAQGNRWVRWLSVVVSEGPYHYLHHSAEPAENSARGNLVNIGGGMGFMWDRIFGTFRPVTPYRPQVGLHGSPTLYMNPLRLALAGIAQLMYELYHNPGMLNKLRVLCMGSDFTPAHSRDYAIKAQPTVQS